MVKKILTVLPESVLCVYSALCTTQSWYRFHEDFRHSCGSGRCGDGGGRRRPIIRDGEPDLWRIAGQNTERAVNTHLSSRLSDCPSVRPSDLGSGEGVRGRLTVGRGMLRVRRSGEVAESDEPKVEKEE